MTEVLNFYLTKYGLLDPKLEEKKIDSNEKAKQRWDLLKKSIRSASELVEKDDLKNNKVSHGIQFVKRITNNFNIEQADYLIGMDSYMILDGQFVRLLNSDGRFQNCLSFIDIGASFSRLLWANISERFVAWTPGNIILSMLDKNFKIIEIVDESLIKDPIFQLFYNEDKNEIISTHSEKIIIWQFRYANKHLLPKKEIPLNFKDHIPTLLCLERTQSKDQKLFIANDCGVIIVCISNACLLSQHPLMHERPITALTFFNPLKLLVTGCKDGSIKIWSLNNSDMDLRMIFVGHTAPVTSLAIFPGGCQATIASSGKDNTLRVWSLEINDEIECIELDYSPNYIKSEISKMSFFTVFHNFVDIWKQNHVLNDILTLPGPAVRMEMSLGDKKTILVSCKNNLTFLINPSQSSNVLTKTVISTQHIPDMEKNEKLCILSSVVLEAIQVMFILTNKNRILQYNTKTLPMVLKRKSQCLLTETLIMLALYNIGNDQDTKTKNKNLLLSGSNNGFILVHDFSEPENILFKIDAHSPSSIACLITNPSNSKLFSSGYDNSIKVWHIYPFASEPLTREISFFCGHLPINLINIENYLFTIFHDVDGAQYPAVIYNINNRTRYDHSPNDDHNEPVNSVSAARKMKLFLSSSAGLENIIKIWTCKNVLLRQIEVHFPLNCSVFSSEKADIFVSVGNQICNITHETYLPRVYIKKQVLMYFEETSLDMVPKIIKIDEKESENMFTSRERDILNGIKAVFKYQNYEDILPELEAKEVALRNDTIEKGFEKIKSIEDDIKRLQMGQYEKVHQKYSKYVEKPKESDILSSYLSEFMKFYKIPLPTDMKEDSDEGKKYRKSEKYKESDKIGFFPSYKSIRKSTCKAINPDGFIPNSTILNKLWPSELIREKADVWKTPTLSSLDRALARAKAIIEIEEDSPKFFDWDSDDEEKIIESPVSEKYQETELSEDILSKYSSILNEIEVKRETEVYEPEVLKEVIKRPVSTKITRESLNLPTITRMPATMPELRKKDKIRASSSPKEVEIKKEDEHSNLVHIDMSSKDNSSFFITETVEKERSKPASILPKFLLRFVEEEWFQKLCPLPHDHENCLLNIKKPLTPTNFCKQLLQLSQTAKDTGDILTFIDAIQRVYSEDNIEKATIMNIHKVLRKIVNDIKKMDSDEKIALLRLCLKVMVTLEGVSDKAVVVICLSRYFDANEELRGYMKSLLCHLGLEDDENVIPKQLEEFKLFSIDSSTERINDLQVMVSEWLEKWFQSMLNFASDCRVLVGEEINLLNSNIRKPSKKVSSCLKTIMDIFHLNITNQVDFMQLYPLEKCSKSVLTYINCLNFVRYKVLLKKQKITISEKHILEEEADEIKKTILSLPKINPNKQYLVRIGESNADKVDFVKRKEYSLLNSMWSKNTITDQTQHPAMQPLSHYQIAVGGGFVPYMHLHLKPCLVNPFPRPEDILEWESINSKSLFLSAKRSFIPQFSLPPEPF